MRIVLFLTLLLVACTGAPTAPISEDHGFVGARLDAMVAGGADSGVDVAPSPVTDSGTVPVDARADAVPPVDAQTVDMGPPRGNPFTPRQPNATCRLPEPPAIGAYVTERAFPQLRFNRPLWIGTAPCTIASACPWTSGQDALAQLPHVSRAH